ncbi:hypothetical protein KA517_05195 [Candidatus Gracilibacteria bacterium]|nr:hypothetical protein [Candidatus Gracilibacteria bacterium]
MTQLLPPSMTAPDKQDALTKMGDRVALAKVLQGLSSVENVTPVTLAEYRAALAALPADPLLTTTWQTFLDKFQPRVVQGGVKLEPAVRLDNGQYLLAVLPVNLNGTVWRAEQIAAGAHFFMVGLDPVSGYTNTGDRFPKALPEEVVAAGQVHITADQNETASVVAAFQAAYERIVALVVSK